MKKSVLISGICLAVIGLAGCGSEAGSTQDDSNLTIHHVNVDGQEITCVVNGGMDGGISCNFG